MAGTSWPSLVAGQKARANDVELKFDWLEGSLAPMSGGSLTNSVHDLGTTTAFWRKLYLSSGIIWGGLETTVFFNSTDGSDANLLQIGGGGAASVTRGGYLNLYGNEYAGAGGGIDVIAGNTADSTSAGRIRLATGANLTRILIWNDGTVGIGTDTPNTNAVLDVTGTKSILLPRLSTAQRDALTAADGMVLYNSNTSQFQARENGAWVGMVGARIGLKAKVQFSTASASTQTALSFTGSGRLISNYFSVNGGAGTCLASMILDSVTSSNFTASTSSTPSYIIGEAFGFTSGSFAQTSAATRADLFFNNQLKVFVSCPAATATVTSFILYEGT